MGDEGEWRGMDVAAACWVGDGGEGVRRRGGLLKNLILRLV